MVNTSQSNDRDPVVDLSELRASVDRELLVEQQQAEQQQLEKEQLKEKQALQAELKAASIIEMIPTVLNSENRNCSHTDQGRVLQAEVPVVRERFTSIMDSRGRFSEFDMIVLNKVRERLKTLSIPNVEVELNDRVQTGGFMSADGLDQVSGPCTEYYLSVTVYLDKK